MGGLRRLGRAGLLAAARAVPAGTASKQTGFWPMESPMGKSHLPRCSCFWEWHWNHAARRAPRMEMGRAGVSHRRHLSGAAEGANSSQEVEGQPTLEKVLRSLYVRVHPDLFSAFPNARAQNEEGLKATLPTKSMPTSELCCSAAARGCRKIALMPRRRAGALGVP
jgi:hypothetical protein